MEACSLTCHSSPISENRPRQAGSRFVVAGPLGRHSLMDRRWTSSSAASLAARKHQPPVQGRALGRAPAASFRDPDLSARRVGLPSSSGVIRQGPGRAERSREWHSAPIARLLAGAASGISDDTGGAPPRQRACRTCITDLDQDHNHPDSYPDSNYFLLFKSYDSISWSTTDPLRARSPECECRYKAE